MSPRRRRSTPSSATCVRLELRGAPVLGVLIVASLVGTLAGLWLDGRTGALPATLLLAIATLLAARPLAALFRSPADGPRALLFDEDGQFWLEMVGRMLRAVEVHGTSLVRGPWVVLRLSSGADRFRIVIETSRSQAGARAALARALRRRAAAPGRPRHALRSLLERGEPGP